MAYGTIGNDGSYWPPPQNNPKGKRPTTAWDVIAVILLIAWALVLLSSL